jgi:hypothetical protein
VYAGVHHSDQRSRVARLRVTFSTRVAFDPGAFQVVRRDGLRVPVRVASSLVSGRTVALLTFLGPAVAGGSLPDGNYTLTLRGAGVHNSDGTSGSDHVYSFFRLYGDADGDRDVDAVDRAALGRTLNRHRGDAGFLAYFDSNGDGVIDRADKQQFDRRRGRYLLP